MPLIDEGVLLGVSGGCPELAGELVDTFLEELPSEWASLAEAVERREALQAERAAHRLCGSLGLVGANGMAEHARDLERLAKAHRLDALDGPWQALQQGIRELEPALAQWRRRLAGH